MTYDVIGRLKLTSRRGSKPLTIAQGVDLERAREAVRLFELDPKLVKNSVRYIKRK